MRKTANKVTIKTFEQPDEVRRFEKGRLELVRTGEATIGRATFEPGWKWSECVKPLAHTSSCESAHLGYQLSGTMQLVTDDGNAYTMRAGDVIDIPPGHDAWVVGDEAVVVIDFQGMTDYAKEKTPKLSPEQRSGRRH